ncbi:extra spindle pole bodies like 1, separase [Homo sapiens]|uniref:Extra spindle pole bodies like 1, separase n=1 Tax=Homo sapiens TaxID=9606 RepID=H3BM31_HUMAN|nr:extra spindle pole bodies like 1, separase [Homo sapiens]
MRSFKRVNFGTLLSSQKEAEELLPALKVGVLPGSGYTWLSKLSCFVFAF